MPSKKLLKISYSVITTKTNTNFELAKLTIAMQSDKYFYKFIYFLDRVLKQKY